MSNQLTAIIDDYKAGISIKDLATWYGVGVDWLRVAVTDEPPQRLTAEEARATKRTRTPKYPDELFIKYHALGLYNSAIAREIGCGKTTVSNRLAELGLEPNKRSEAAE